MTPARNGRFAVEPPEAGGPRRSALLQERSRHTRRQLVRAAITLWTDRGFESGIEDTTVEEIAREAGVTKGTFYFHFAHKEDILLEIGWATAEAMLAEADRAMRRGRTTTQIVDGILSSLARRVERAPRATIVRIASEFSRRALDLPERPDGEVGFHDAFTAVIEYGQERGELPGTVDADELGEMLQLLMMDAIVRWAIRGKGSLRVALQRIAQVVLVGVVQVYAAPAARR
ncbi:MAG TPA: helix-turn-helix domain-containing protein [Acidimicrobiales bacterium]|nr:helix-turn-helix domain-containing protein [Acidimicrobiales bacterium]